MIEHHMNELRENETQVSAAYRRREDGYKIAAVRDVFCQQQKPLEYMNELDCRIMAWGPLAEGRNGFFQNELLAGIGRKYGKSIAQVALRWLLQRGVIIIPRSTKQKRMAQNLMLDDFTLSAEDMEQIKTLDTGRSILFDHHDGDTTKMFMGWRNIEDLYKQV